MPTLTTAAIGGDSVGVNYGTALTIEKTQALLSPAMGVKPLAAMLKNANSSFRVHKPPLVSFAPMMTVDNRNRSFTVGIVPSADGIRYQVMHLVLPSYTGSLTYKVESGRGDPAAWTILAGPTAQAVTTGTWVAYQQFVTIATTEDRLRFTYSAAGGSYLVSHVLVWPDPDPALVPLVAPFMQQPSGFWPADDALLVAGGPVHTEMLTRCWRNAVAMLRDRRQIVGSFVQDDGQFGAVRHRAPFSTVAVSEWALIGKARAFLPYQAGAMLGLTEMRPALYIMAQASVSAGTTATRVRVVARGANGKESQALLNATGAMVTATIYADSDASPDAGVDLEWYVRCASGQTVSLHSAILLWQPGT